MPYTAKQRRMFNARAKSDPKMAELAEEANAMAKAGKERKPVANMPAKITKKQMPSMPAKKTAAAPAKQMAAAKKVAAKKAAAKKRSY